MFRHTTEKFLPSSYPPQAQLDHTVILARPLVYIIGYYNDKNKPATWEQITVLEFPLVAAYCVSVPRLLHCPSRSESAAGKRATYMAHKTHAKHKASRQTVKVTK